MAAATVAEVAESEASYVDRLAGLDAERARLMAELQGLEERERQLVASAVAAHEEPYAAGSDALAVRGEAAIVEERLAQIDLEREPLVLLAAGESEARADVQMAQASAEARILGQRFEAEAVKAGRALARYLDAVGSLFDAAEELQAHHDRTVREPWVREWASAEARAEFHDASRLPLFPSFPLTLGQFARVHLLEATGQFTPLQGFGEIVPAKADGQRAAQLDIAHSLSLDGL